MVWCGGGKSVNNPQCKLCVIEDFGTRGSGNGGGGGGVGGDDTEVMMVLVTVRIECIQMRRCVKQFYGKIHLTR